MGEWKGDTLIFLLTAFFPSPALLELVPFVEVLYSVLKIGPIYFLNTTNFKLNLPPNFQSKLGVCVDAP